MRKTFLFILSITVAFGITFYIKKNQSEKFVEIKPQWKTFAKNEESKIISHDTTKEEFKLARIPAPPELNDVKHQRNPASVDKFAGRLIREKRVLTGDVDKKLEDTSFELPMHNAVNPEWKEHLGKSLIILQDPDTKVLVVEETPVIDVHNGKGRYMEEVIITYLKKNGDRSSYRALVDSSSGEVIETWDRTIQEQILKKRGGITLPSHNDSGIITR